MVADLLEAQAVGDELPVIAGQLDRARVAEEVGRVEEVDVERVALDPLGAVEEPAQRADLDGSTSTPNRSSNAWTALIWYATGQMPQIRATMSRTSSGVRPTTSASK